MNEHITKTWIPTPEEAAEMIERSGPKYEVYKRCKEVAVTTDSKKAAEMLQTNNWVIAEAAFKANGEIEWHLMRI